MYSTGFGIGPKRAVVPTLGSKVVAPPPVGLLTLRRQIADVVLNEIGIVLPGSAWMLFSTVGSVNVMLTRALLLPTTCHSPAVTPVGRTVVATPLGTDPKSRFESVVIVIPGFTTKASTPRLATLPWAAAEPVATSSQAAPASRPLTGPAPRPNRARPGPAIRRRGPGLRARPSPRSAASTAPAAACRPGW